MITIDIISATVVLGFIAALITIFGAVVIAGKWVFVGYRERWMCRDCKFRQESKCRGHSPPGR